MTNFEAISAEIYPYDVDENLISKSCIDQGVNGDTEYDLSQKIGVAKAVIAVLRRLVVLSSEGNGGYSLSYDTEELRKRIFDVASENGLADIAEEFNSKPTISTYSGW